MQKSTRTGWMIGTLFLSWAAMVVLVAQGPAVSAPKLTTTTSGCTPPVFPAGTPAPDSVTGPSQPPSASSRVAVESAGGSIEDLTPVCQWTLSFDPPTGDPTVTFTQYSNTAMALATGYRVSYTNNTGVSCHFTAEVLNGFGGGGAQETLNSSNCNTDGYGPGEGSVQSTLVNGATGPVEGVASFNSTVTSFAAGANVSYGEFNACSENPVGSHTNYACNYFFGGPSL
jgi:hypothetical protein